MKKINERLFLPGSDNIDELKRQLQFAWSPMAQMLNSLFTLYIQDTMPTIPNNATALWIDNTTPGALKYYSVVNFGGTHKKVEMT
jgi:hypothetical protein